MAVYETEDLVIEKGEVVLVCGYTGSGKTTLLNRIRENANTIASYVFQNPEESIVCDLVYEELAFALQCGNEPDDVIKRRIAETAGYFSLGKLMNCRTESLSGGEKQILAVAAAMVTSPELLLLDEPLAMLDPVMSERMTELVLRLNREFGTTIVIAEHNYDNLFAIADKIVLVDKAQTVCKTPEKMAEYMRENNYEKLLPAVARLFSTDTVLTMSKARELAKKTDLSASGHKKPSITGDVILKVKNLTFGYEKYKPLLKDISFELHRGEVLSILGENGCGKTTLADLISGRKKPFSGKVKLRSRNEAAYLFQDAGCHFLEDEMDGKHIYDMSGGERQLYALDGILAGERELLILDEPTKALDAAEKEGLKKRISEYAGKGNGVILITHDIDFAAGVSDCMALLSCGEISALESADKFIRKNIFYTTVEQKVLR